MNTDPNPFDAFDIGSADLSAILATATKTVSGPDGRVAIDPAHVERDLAKLVLVVVELLRRLMEHQALARMDRGTLSESQIDALSDGLLKARTAIETLREDFGIPPEAFNIDLGPLGKIL